MKHKSPNERLKEELKRLGLNYSDVSEATGLTERTIIRILKPGASLKVEHLIPMKEKLGVNISYVLSGRESDREGGHDNNVADDDGREIDFTVHNVKSSTGISTLKEEEAPYSDSGEFTLIPFYNVAAEAGEGMVGEDREPLPFAFRTYWLRNILHLNPSQLFVMKIAGDSMYPTLQSNDTVLVDQLQKKVGMDDIYIIRMDDVYRAKRIQHLPGGKLQLSSDNELYPPFTIDPGDDTVEIIGRIVWLARTNIK